MAFPDKNYTFGRYRVYFDKFAPGTKTPTGQRYFGNTPELSLASESENLDHFDADNGVRVKDDTMLLELTRNGSFTTDHISPDNLAAFFLGESSVVNQVLAAGVTYDINAPVKNRRYQIGANSAAPAGVRGISTVSVASNPAGTVYTEGTDYTVDLETGGLTILPGSTIAGNIRVTYTATATTYNRIVSADSASIYGSMFLESRNPKGDKQDYFFPYVELRPDGDFELKGEEWQTLPFSFDVLKLDDNTAAVYINGRPGVNVVS
jgi:hypothetical protein